MGRVAQTPMAAVRLLTPAPRGAATTALLPAGCSVDKLSQDVGVTGMPDGPARHSAPPFRCPGRRTSWGAGKNRCSPRTSPPAGGRLPTRTRYGNSLSSDHQPATAQPRPHRGPQRVLVVRAPGLPGPLWNFGRPSTSCASATVCWGRSKYSSTRSSWYSSSGSGQATAGVA